MNHESERRALRDFQEAQRKVYERFIRDLPAETRRLVPEDWVDFVNEMHGMLFYDAEKFLLDLATAKREKFTGVMIVPDEPDADSKPPVVGPIHEEPDFTFKDSETGKTTMWKFRRQSLGFPIPPQDALCPPHGVQFTESILSRNRRGDGNDGMPQQGKEYPTRYRVERDT